MGREIKFIAIGLGLLILAPLGTPTFGARGPKNFHAGAGYVLTNQTSNTVVAFRRDARGMLTLAGEFPTGGAGNPVPRPPDPSSDPLASQGALIMSNNNRFLFAVNAGSNQISVLKIK